MATKKKFLRILALALSVVMLMGALAGCGKTPEKAPDAPVESTEPSTPDSTEKAYVPYIGALFSLPYFIDHRMGLEMGGIVYGIDTDVIGPSEYDMTAETTAIEQQAALKPAALLVSAFEDTLSPAINSAVDAGVPVITIDMDTVSSDRQVFIGGDTYDYGRVHARTLAEALDGKGKVLLQWNQGQNGQDQRAQGFKEEIAKYPGIEIVQFMTSDTDTTKDADGFKAALQAHPDVTGISTLVSTGAVAATTAVREMGMQGKVKIIGDSADDATLKLIETGELYATVSIKTRTENLYATMLVDGLLKNNVSISTDDKAAGINALPSFIDIGTFAITKETAEHFYLPKDPTDYSNFVVEAPSKDDVYYCIGALLSLPYFQDHKIGFEAACEELGVTGKFVGPMDYDMTAEAQMIEEAIAQKPKGILVMAFEDTLSPAINKAKAAGIPVITIDMDTLDSERDFFIGGNTYDYGRIHAKTIAEALNGKGKILLQWNQGQNSQDQRAQGFQEEIANYPDIEIVQFMTSDTDTTKDADGFKAALQAHPDIDGISTLVSTGAVAAATAVREMGMQGKVKIIGDSKDDATLKLVEDGEVYATVAIKTRIEPYLAMKILYLMNYTNFSISQNDEAAGMDILPNTVDIGTFVITKDTAQYFYME